MKLIYSICLIFLALGAVNAQNMEAKFSEKMSLSSKKTGFYNQILGETEKYIFVQYKTTKKGKVWLERIGVHDKSTMQEVNSIKVVDGKDAARKAELGDKEKIGIEFFGENIFVFYKEESKTEVKIFGEAYDVNLDQKIKLTEMMSVPKDSKRDRVLPRIMVNNQSILMGRFEEEGNNIHYIYQMFNFEFDQIADANVELPTPEEATEGNLFSVSNYVLDNNDNVYFNESLAIKSSKKKGFLKGNSYKYDFYLTVLNLNSGELDMLDMNAERKSLFNIRLVEEKGEMNIMGFFSDFDKDESGVRTHGIFYRNVDTKTLAISDVVYSYFSEELISELFQNDEEDKLKSRKTRGKKAEEEEEKNQDAISKAFNIEKVIIDEAGNFVLFSSKMNNYTVQHCTTNANGGTTCYTEYLCEKRNVTVFKLTKDGDFVWASNIDRRHTYKGWYIYDLNVIEDENNYYVSYASDYKVDAQDEETEKAKKKRKSRSEYVDQMEYGVFDKQTGENKKNALVLNEPGITKAEKKYCAPTNVQVINNQFYLASVKTYVAPWSYATCLCPPIYMIVLMTQSTIKQDVSIGKVDLIR